MSDQDSKVPLPNLDGDVTLKQPLPEVQDYSEQSVAKNAADLEAVFDVPVQVSAVLGRSRMDVGDLLKLGPGSVLELDRKVGRGDRHLREQPAGGARRGRAGRGQARGHHDGNHQAGADVMMWPIRRPFRRETPESRPHGAGAGEPCVWLNVRRKRRRTPLASLLRRPITSRGRPSSPRNA